MFIKYKSETPERSKKKKIILFLDGKYENKSKNLEDQSLLNNKFSKLKLKRSYTVITNPWKDCV